MNPADMQLFHDEAGRLMCAVRPGAPPVAVRPVLLAPLSQPGRVLALLDEHDSEIGILEDLSALAKESLRAVLRELRRCYLKCRVTAVLRARRQDDSIQWTVRTDQGTRGFVTDDQPENIRWCSRGLLLIDTKGNRFEIEDVGCLDGRSRAVLRRIL